MNNRKSLENLKMIQCVINQRSKRYLFGVFLFNLDDVFLFNFMVNPLNLIALCRMNELRIRKCVLPLCGMSSSETRSIIVVPGQGVTDAPIMAAGVDCNAKILTDFLEPRTH